MAMSFKAQDKLPTFVGVSVDTVRRWTDEGVLAR